MCGASICKIRGCELSMIFSGGVVVGLCGIDLVIEVAETVGFFIGGYLGGPFFIFFVPIDAFIF